MTSAKKILIISLGSIGKRHLRNTRKLLPDAKIAVWRQHTPGTSPVPEGADLLFDDLKAAQAFTPDAVIVASPASEHIANAMPFLGTPMFLEKPLAANCDGLDAFVRAVHKAGGFTMVGYVMRFLPVLQKIHSMVQKGEIGEVRTAHVQAGQYLPDWRQPADYRKGVSAQAALGGGALLELSHEMDYATWIFGAPDALQCSKDRLSDLEIDVEDSAHVILEYARKQKKRVLLQLDFLQRNVNITMQVVGSEGTLQADVVKGTLTLYTPKQPNGAPVPCPVPAANEEYLRQFDLFFHKAFKDYKPVYAETAGFKDWVDIDQAARVMRLVDAAKRADAEGKRQPVTKAA